MKLISMTEFVLTVEVNDNAIGLKGIANDLKKLEAIEQYANFLKQPLTLGMFIPCDEEGNVLEEPKSCNCTNEGEAENCLVGCYKEEQEQYQQAKERVLFKVNKKIKFPLSKNPTKISQYLGQFGIIMITPETIEDLCGLGFSLTESATNQITQAV